MPRGYRQIKECEREISELREQGKSKREICEIGACFGACGGVSVFLRKSNFVCRSREMLFV